MTGDLSVEVRGYHFLPTEDLLLCRITKEDATYIDVQATYVTNTTVLCDLPAPPTPNYEYGVELSINGGHQFTSYGHSFYFRELDEVASTTALSPPLGLVAGSTYLRITYNTFFATSGLA